jgi:UDP-glucose 4-epimerase
MSISSAQLPALFVTGATGFIGSHFVNEALRRGHRVVALRRLGSEPRIKLEREPEWVDGVIGAGDHLPAFAGCHVFVHLAAAGVVPPDDTWENCFRWNVDASLREWIHANEAGMSRFVICGSCFEYGRSGERYEFIPVDAPLEPAGPYHASKAAATMAAYGLTVEKKLQTVIARPFHVYGEGEAHGRLWPMLREAALTAKDLPLTLGEQVRDFTPVSLVVDHLLANCMRDDILPSLPVVHNIGTGNPQRLADFAANCWRAFGASGQLKIGALPYREGEVMRYVPSLGYHAMHV